LRFLATHHPSILIDPFASNASCTLPQQIA
jgi:hypothetical protein